MRRALVVIALVASIVVAPLSAPSTAASKRTRSGLYGVVTRWPTQPVCQEGQPCSAPAAGVTLRFSRLGIVRARATTGELGHYRVRLTPGVYAVSTSPAPSIGRGLEPANVYVRRDRFRRQNFSIDTGIR